MTEAVQTEAVHTERVDFRVSPDQYKHWRLSTDGPVARMTPHGQRSPQPLTTGRPMH